MNQIDLLQVPVVRLLVHQAIVPDQLQAIVPDQLRHHQVLILQAIHIRAIEIQQAKFILLLVKVNGILQAQILICQLDQTL